MKTKSLFVAVVVTMIAMVSAVGKDAPRNAGLAVVPVKGSEVYKVIYKSENTGKVRLNIYNEKSQVIFSEVLNGNVGFIRPLNFSGLSSGEYTFEVVDAAGKKTEKVNFQPVVKSKKNIHVSKVLAENGKFLVAVSNAGVEKINVRIYDALNNLIHSEEKQISGDFAQLYSLKNYAGITFEISDNAGNIKTVSF